MAVWNEDDAQRLAGFGASVTQAVGSDGSIDLISAAKRDSNVLTQPINTETLENAEALRIEHPDYKASVEKWQKYLDLYNSFDVFRFIFRHLRETDTKWKQRVERGYFYNYVKSVVELFTAFLYHHPIDRIEGDNLKEEFQAIYKNADRSGTLWVTLMQEICNFAQVEGQVGILVDLPTAESIGSEQERLDRGIRPFLTLIHSPQIKDWEVDEFGNFVWVKIQVFRPQERNWKTPTNESTETYQIWDRTSWQEWELKKDSESGTGESARMVKSGEHNLGVVPLCIARLERAMHPWFGVSAVKDIADINIGILNWSSLGDEEIFERCLNVLAMEQGDDGRPIELGDGNILEFSVGASHKPFYLEPGATPLERIQAWISHAKDEIRRLAKINLSAGLGDVRQASSGIAKAYSFVETNQSLAAKALNMEQVEQKIHSLIASYYGRTFEGSISYPREFGVEDWLTLYQELQSARSTLTSETAIKEIEKQVVRKAMARLPIDLRDQAIEEIESGNSINPNDIGMEFGMTPPNFINGLNQDEEDLETPNLAEPGDATGA